MKKTDRLAQPSGYWDVEIKDLTVEGMGIARVDGLVVMVESALPGDRLRVKETKRHRKFSQARIVEVLEESPDRVDALCPHHAGCGGCRLQHAQYQAQLRYKSKQVADAMQRIGHLQNFNLRPIIPAEHTFGYRNKLEFTCSDRRWLLDSEIASGIPLSRQAIGFHAPKAFDKVIDIHTCLLQDERSNQARNALRKAAIEQNLSFYNTRTHTGFLRNLTIRTAFNTQDFMFLLVVGELQPELIDKLFGKLKNELDFVTEWIWIHNPKANDSYTDLKPYIWEGKGYILDQLGPYVFRIGPVSFFQTNPQQAKRLFDLVREAIGQRIPLLFDLYCGAGSIGIYVSDLAERIVGVDYVEAAIADAKLNAELNKLSHLEFEAGNLARMFDSAFIERYGRPDVVVVDPPRAGMDSLVVKQLLELRPRQIVYVSCNPTTQARDLALLQSEYYVEWLQPIDLFPHTLHVETVANLQLSR